tara:strand:+ start:622 stop:879 length:258 start_codon:yes stop_codon:yes gene_type:complete
VKRKKAIGTDGQMKRLPRKRWRQLVRQYNKGCSAKFEMNAILRKHCTDKAFAVHDDQDDMDYSFEDDLKDMIERLEDPGNEPGGF